MRFARGLFRRQWGRNLCYGRTCRARARLIEVSRHQRRRRANSTNGRSTTANRALGTERGTRTEERGLLTVCRLNVLGPLLNQLTYCLCGRQPLPCLHGTFLLSFPPSLSPPDGGGGGGGGVPSVRRCHPPPFSLFLKLRTPSVSLRVYTADVFSMTDASANTRICLRFLAAARGHHRIFRVCNGRQLKIDAPLSPTIFLPIFVFKFASGYAAPLVCSVGVILTVYRGQGFTSDGGLSCNLFFFCLFFFFTLSWRLTRSFTQILPRV